MLPNLLYNILSFAFVISVIVFVHEFGHYIIARFSGVKVEVFSIGFGRKLFGKKDKHGTDWRISLIPLGGYVKMHGENLLSQKIKPKFSFAHKSVGKRIAIVSAGPLANFVFSFLLMIILLMIQGRMISSNIVKDVMPDMPAMKAGIEKNDQILSVNGKDINNIEDLVHYLEMYKTHDLLLKIKRDHKILQFKLKPQIIKTQIGSKTVESPKLGIIADTKWEKVTLIQAPFYAAKYIYKITIMTFSGIGEIFMLQRSTEELSGIIGIAKLSGESAQQGYVALLWFMIIISVNLGAFNLLPVPMLDGGHLLFYIVELVTGKALSAKAQSAALRFGLILLVSLMLLATYNDISKF